VTNSLLLGIKGERRSYFDYYLNARTHRSLGRNAPIEREVEPPYPRRIVAVPQVGGLHHRYRRAA
jgi:hypothetical protein